MRSGCDQPEIHRAFFYLQEAMDKKTAQQPDAGTGVPPRSGSAGARRDARAWSAGVPTVCSFEQPQTAEEEAAASCRPRVSSTRRVYKRSLYFATRMNQMIRRLA